MTRERTSSARRVFGSRFFFIGLLAIALLIAINVARAYYQDYKIRQEISALKEEVKKLEQKKIESLKILQYVSDKAFVEEKARTELNLKQPDEGVLYLNDKKSDLSTHTLVEQKKQSLNNPMKWWYYITRHSLPD